MSRDLGPHDGLDLAFNPFYDAEHRKIPLLSSLLWGPLAVLRIFAAVFWTAVYLAALSLFLFTETAILIAVSLIIPGVRVRMQARAFASAGACACVCVAG